MTHTHTHTVELLWTRNRPFASESKRTLHNTNKRHFSVLGGIRNCNPSKRAVVNPHRRPRGPLDRHYFFSFAFVRLNAESQENFTKRWCVSKIIIITIIIIIFRLHILSFSFAQLLSSTRPQTRFSISSSSFLTSSEPFSVGPFSVHTTLLYSPNLTL